MKRISEGIESEKLKVKLQNPTLISSFSVMRDYMNEEGGPVREIGVAKLVGKTCDGLHGFFGMKFWWTTILLFVPIYVHTSMKKGPIRENSFVL